MNQLIISVVVGVALTAAAATMLRSRAASTHTVGAVSSKAPDSCRRGNMPTGEYQGMSLLYSSKDQSAQ